MSEISGTESSSIVGSDKIPFNVDLLVVGGGPAGAACALEARRLGIEKVLILDKGRPGRLKPCAGGLSPRAEKTLRSMDLWEILEPKLYPISSARIVHRNQEMEFAGEQSASVMHRAAFDAALLSEAGSAGASILYETQVADPLLENDRCVGVRLTEAGRELRAAVTVFAAGAGTSLVKDSRPRNSLTSCTAWYEGVDFPPGRMDMIFPEEISPHYLWLFPEAEGRANIGMCLFPSRLKGRKISNLFDELVDLSFSDRLAGAHKFAGPLVHPIRPARWFENHAPAGALVCGEQAGLVNGFTGEGISLALESGRAAGQTAAELLAQANTGTVSAEQIMNSYEKAVRQASAGALRSGRLLCSAGPGLLRLTAAFAGSKCLTSLSTRLMSKA